MGNKLEVQETHIPSIGICHSSERCGRDYVEVDGDPRGIGEDVRKHM